MSLTDRRRVFWESWWWQVGNTVAETAESGDVQEKARKVPVCLPPYLPRLIPTHQSHAPPNGAPNGNNESPTCTEHAVFF